MIVSMKIMVNIGMRKCILSLHYMTEAMYTLDTFSSLANLCFIVSIDTILHGNKTRGLRRWPTRDTKVLECKKLHPWRTEISEFQVRNAELLETSVPKPSNLSMKFGKISHPEPLISLTLLDFIKEVCQLPDS